MFFPSLHSLYRQLTLRWPLLLRTALWTVLLIFTVVVASFAPEIAFISSISPSSSSSEFCSRDGFVRILLEFPGESVCLPGHMVRRSNLDFFVPTVFAALVVAGSACVIRSFFALEGG